MKKLLLLGLMMCLCLAGFSQTRKAPRLFNPHKDVSMKAPLKGATDETVNFLSKPADPAVQKGGLSANEFQVGNTRYDLQSNSSTQNRIYKYGDGTFGVTWTFGLTDPSFPDRGTGYNYFDGTSWGPEPTLRIENKRCGWPSYAPLGESGEIVVNHNGSTGLEVVQRPSKSTGAWSEATYPGPTGHVDILWPRMVTSGPVHGQINIIAVTPSVVNGGTVYNGQDGSIVYSRSNDGGTTWNKNNVVLPGTGGADYTGFNGDIYQWAEPVGDTLAFLVADGWCDIFMMKSTDGGDNWTKTVIFQHPYPHFVESSTLVLDTPTVSDGAAAIALDHEGKAHVVFGIMRVLNDDTTDANTSYFPYTSGMGYWDEDMPTMTNITFDSLNDRNQLVGWFQDFNGNDTMDLIDIGTYYLSLTSMPQITIDNDNNMFITMSNVMENLDNGSQNYRHINARASYDHGQTWTDFIDLTGGITHNFHECVFSSMAAGSDDNIYYAYQADEEPGLALRGDEDPYGDNMIIFAKVPKSDFCGINAGFTVDHQTVDLAVSGAVQFTDASTGSVISWAWDFGDGGTSNIQNPSHTYTAVGDYTARLTASDGVCTDIFTMVIHVINNNGIRDNSNFSFVSQNVPNPFTTTSEVKVKLVNASSLSLDVFDLVGKKVMSLTKGNVNPGTHTFSIDGTLLDKGVYFYTVTAGNSKITRKMVVR